MFARTITRPAVPFRLPMPARRNPDTPVPARRPYRPPRHYPSHSRTPYAPGERRGPYRRPVCRTNTRRAGRRVGTLTRAYRHASRRQASRFLATGRRQASRFLATGRRQASRFLANAGQRRRQRRAIGAGRPERRNRPAGERHRFRIGGVVDDAPHHTPATPRLDEPQTAVGPGDDRHSPVTHRHHRSPLTYQCQYLGDQRLERRHLRPREICKSHG